MRALVTGAAGLIGSHLVDELVRAGHRVRGFDNLEPLVHREGRPQWLSSDAEFIEGDVRDADAIGRALAGIDTVFHLAAYGGFFPELGKLCDVNVTGTARLLEIIRDRRVDIRKVVIASSQVIYREGTVHCDLHGDLDAPQRSLEQLDARRWDVVCPACGGEARSVATSADALALPQTPYAISKYAQERLALVWGVQSQIPVTALRYPCTYGPRQSVFNPYTGIIAIFSTRVIAGKSPVVYEDGLQTRDLCYVEDIARATAFAGAAGVLDGQAANVGSGRPVTVAAVARAVLDALESNLELEMAGDFRPGDMRALFTDPQPLAELGFRTRVDLASGIERYVAWICARGRLEEYFTAAQEHLRTSGLVRRARPAISAHA